MMQSSFLLAVNAIQKELCPNKVIEEFADATSLKNGTEIESVAMRIFGGYGESIMKRILDIKGAVAMTSLSKGDINEWYIPQQFIIMAYTAVQPIFFQLKVVENNWQRFVFRIDDCVIFNALKEKCGEEIVRQMPCKHACLTLSEIAYRGLDSKVNISMDALMAKDGYCQFTAENLEI